MGHARIIIRPTSMTQKKVGQLKKLFGLWENSKKTTDKDNKTNPRPEMTDGKPTFLQRDSGVTQGFVTRRQIVLNRHFTEILSDILATSLKMQLSEIGVTITSIETKAWNHGVRLFYTTNNPFDPHIHQTLNSMIPQLRSAVAEQMRLGRVPLMNFVYDETEKLHQDLDSILSQLETDGGEDEKSLLKTESNDLQPTRENKKKREFTLSGKSFSAPEGMSNMILGLDYPSLYNEVSTKLERGRGQSERMIKSDSITSTAPVFQLPLGETEIEDPAKRVLDMQKFLIRQKKKTEYMSKMRRKGELLYRDQYKWDIPDETTEVQEEVRDEPEEAGEDEQ